MEFTIIVKHTLFRSLEWFYVDEKGRLYFILPEQ